MLRRFEVENYKGFARPIVFDFAGRDYLFNKGLLKNGLVNKAILYGKNGIGKSTLGTALFDITHHLTDKNHIKPVYLTNYRNLYNPEMPVHFRYSFLFDQDEIEYEYYKFNADDLRDERLTINGKVVVNYDYTDKSGNYIDPELTGQLKVDLHDNKLSVLKYIYRNIPTDESSPFQKMMSFCDNMLWYRSLSEGNAYAGFTNGSATLVQSLFDKDGLSGFKAFLAENELDYDLGFEVENGSPQLYAYFHNGGVTTRAPFTAIASTGTMALFLFYHWKLTAFEKVNFLFIDEFDAFLHCEAAENLVKTINGIDSFQAVLTTHNTNLISNRISRPDCCYIMTRNKITSFANATTRELREGHNLEKLYLSGEFNG